MRRIMVIQHIACEPLGSFAREASGGRTSPAANARFIYIRPYEGEAIPASLDGWDGLIVLGGPMAVYMPEDMPYIEEVLGLLRDALAKDFPVLGICLGSQLIARAAGAEVFAGPSRELGFSTVHLTAAAAEDALFTGLPDPLPVFQLHGDTFDLPAGATLLATGEVYANQAFRIGSRVYGLQFHIEVHEELVREWVSFYEEYISGGGASPAEILQGPGGGYGAFEKNAAVLIGRFLAL